MYENLNFPQIKFEKSSKNKNLNQIFLNEERKYASIKATLLIGNHGTINY